MTDAPRARVLVVDDDPPVLDFFVTALAQFGYVPVAAGGGNEALLLLETEDVDLVVTDVAMPGMSGLRLLETIKKTRASLPVILVSGFITGELMQHALAAGAAAVLDKPIRPTDLVQAIDQALATPTT